MPCTPLGKLAVVIDRAGVIVIDRLAVVFSLGLPESRTCTVKVAVVAVVGVPEITPLVLNVSPVGRVPVAIAKA